jgi:Domain of unknown function (DUF4169)
MPLHCRMMEAKMGELVNLNRAKKRNQREQAEKQADINRARFGRTKSERARDELLTSRANDHLDQHRVDSKDAS